MGKRHSFVDDLPRRVQSKIHINLAPGPGSYRVPSDFGHYDEKFEPGRISASKGT